MTSDLTDGVPSMGAETGYELDEQARAPVRVSGFVCLILGLLSAAALLGKPLLVFPVAAIVSGLVALRPSGDGRPVGTTPAKIGVVLAIGFGFCGYFLPWMKSDTLGRQAEYFGREYLQLIAQDEAEMAMELRYDYASRHLSMPLDLYYQRDEEAKESLEEFRLKAAYQEVLEAGPDVDWQLTEPVRVYRRYGHDKAETLWARPGGSQDEPIQLILEYRVDPDTGEAQWHVDTFQIKRERIVAESIL